eukprot:1456915-Prymnesium_polylepis.1
MATLETVLVRRAGFWVAALDYPTHVHPLHPAGHDQEPQQTPRRRDVPRRAGRGAGTHGRL